jgi:hypothetical protein
MSNRTHIARRRRQIQPVMAGLQEVSAELDTKTAPHTRPVND